jgi:ethanolamine ammonia-lyase large subunit
MPLTCGEMGFVILKVQLFNKTYQFKDLKDLLAKANDEKSG